MEFLLIITTMLVVGLFAVLSWDSTFPNRRDVLVLAPLPVRGRTIFLAKIAAVATAIGLTVLMLHSLAGLFCPLALNRTAPARELIDFRFDSAIPPVKAANLQSVLDRDLAPILHHGGFGPTAGGGVSIGVYQQGVRRIFSYGAAQPDSMFEIGSISKTFTGLILAQMIEQDQVRLDQPLRELLPAGLVNKPAGREISLLDLATHHSGLPGMPRNFHSGDPQNPYADYHAEQLYESLRIYPWGVRNPLPTHFAYSNLGFGVLGQVLADRAGTDYPELLRQQVTAPLGLHDTVIRLSPEQQRRFIQGYDSAQRPVHPTDLDALAGAGGIRSTAGDMLTYLEAQLHPERWRGAGTLGDAIALTHVLRADAGKGIRIGLSWMYTLTEETYEHNGATAGFTAYAYFHPKDDSAVVVLANNGGSGVLGLHIRQRMDGRPAQSVAFVKVPATGGVLSFFRLFAVYWLVMLASGVFIFCCVLALQGLTAQLLPRQLFLRLSPFLQMGALCVFVCVYILQLINAGTFELLAGLAGGPLGWSPGFWFLGMFQQLNGSPFLPVLARRAWIGLAAAGGVTAVVYLLSYLRTMRQIVEEPDILRSGRAGWWPAFGGSLSRVVMHFSARTLLRSRQHRIILAFFMGIAFGAAIFFLNVDHDSVDDTRYVAISIMTMCALVAGVRVVFSLPLELRANWVFRAAPIEGGRALLHARRRAYVLLSVAPAAVPAVFLWIWPWWKALGHAALLALFGLLLVELCLMGFQKIPFTCSYLPGKSNFHLTFWFCVGLIIKLVELGGQAEQAALESAPAFGALAAGLAAGIFWLRTRNARRVRSDAEILFEEEPSSAILVLGLDSEGGLPAAPAAAAGIGPP